MIAMLDSETEPLLLLQELRICSTLLSITPYPKMRAGLASLLLRKVVSLLKDKGSLINTSKNPALVNISFKTLLTGFSLPQELSAELIGNFLEKNDSNLIKFLLVEDYLGKGYDQVILLLTKIASSFPE